MLELKYKKVLDEWFEGYQYITLNIWETGILNQVKSVTCLCDGELYFIRLFLSPSCDVLLSVDGQKNLSEIDKSYLEPMDIPEMPNWGTIPS